MCTRPGIVYIWGHSLDHWQKFNNGTGYIFMYFPKGRSQLLMGQGELKFCTKLWRYLSFKKTWFHIWLIFTQKAPNKRKTSNIMYKFINKSYVHNLEARGGFSLLRSQLLMDQRELKFCTNLWRYLSLKKAWIHILLILTQKAPNNRKTSKSFFSCIYLNIKNWI